MQNIKIEYILSILAVTIIALIGYIIITILNQNRRLQHITNSLKAKNIELNTKNLNLQQQLEELIPLKELKESYYQLKGSYNILLTQLKELKNNLEEAKQQLKKYELIKNQNQILQQSLEQKEQFIKELEDKLSHKFDSLANKIFENKTSRFLEDSNTHIKRLLEPFNKELSSFKEQVEKINTTQNQSISMLRGELLQIKELNQALSKEANALVNALKNDSKVQGNWGELILERALESCGLKEGIEYKKEQYFKSDNGNLRADVILNLPDNKHIVIDAKVSLKSYTEILKLQEPSEIEKAKKRHIISIKRHIDILASKQYHKLEQIKAPEFTLMFIPIEGAYLMALEIDSSIFEYAFERGVAVVTPTTLLTTLKTVSTLWKLANHDKDMQTLAKEAALLHDKFALFLDDFNTIEQRLNQAISSWENAKAKLISGQGNLHNRIRKIGELSGKTKKKLSLIDSSS